MVCISWLSSTFTCTISFCSLPQAGKVYYTYFIAIKTEVQRGSQIVKSKARARNSTSGILASLLSTVSVTTSTAPDQCQAVCTQLTWKIANNTDICPQPAGIRIFINKCNLKLVFGQKKNNHLVRVWGNRDLYILWWKRKLI